MPQKARIEIMKHIQFLNKVAETCLITAFYYIIIVILDALLKLAWLIVQYLILAEGHINFWITLSEMFEVNRVILFANILAVVVFSIAIATQQTLLQNHLANVNEYLLYLFFGFLLWRLTNLKLIKDDGAFSISNTYNLDISSGLAYNYYYGYLKIILPSTGTTSKGIFEKLENAEDLHNIKIPLKKLVILIPSSGYIPPDLKQASYQWMESAVNLEEEIRDRAGVKQRSYKNVVYKIYPGGPNSTSSPLYVAVEGATPLLSLFQLQIHRHNGTKIDAKYMTKVVQRFYYVLRDLIENDPECSDVCELLYYNDKNSDGTKVNIAELLIQTISEKT